MPDTFVALFVIGSSFALPYTIHVPTFFFFTDTTTTEIYTLSLHDALPIYGGRIVPHLPSPEGRQGGRRNSFGWLLFRPRSEEHTSELQSLTNLVCRLLLEKKKKKQKNNIKYTIRYVETGNTV